MATPVLSTFAFQYGDDGILINGDSAAAPYLDIKSVEGLDNAPYKTSAKEYDGQDGGTFNGEFEGMRKIVITGEIHGGSFDSNPIEPLLDNLKANFAPTTVAKPLHFYPYGVAQRMVNCKSEGFHYSWEAMRRWNSSPFEIRLTAEDPTIYASTLKTVTGILMGDSPGYSFNHGFNYSFGGVTNPLTPQLNNAGNKPVGFIAKWEGQAVVNPRILSSTSSMTLSLDLSISTTDILIVDFYKEAVWFNGSSRRKAVLEEGWFKLQPGYNDLTYQADSTNLSYVDFIYRDGFR